MDYILYIAGFFWVVFTVKNSKLDLEFRLPFSAFGQNCPKTRGYKSSQNSSKLPKLKQYFHKNSSKITY